MLVPKFAQGDRVIWTRNNPDEKTHRLVDILEPPMLNVEVYEAEAWKPWLDRKEVIYVIKIVDKNFGEVLMVAENVLQDQYGWENCPGKHRTIGVIWQKRVRA